MTKDLSSQLAGYFADVDETQGAIDVAELVYPDPVTPLPHVPRSAGLPARTGLLIAAAAAIVALLLTIPLLVSLRGDSPPATTPSTVTTTSVTPTTTPNEGATSASLSVADLPDEFSAGWRWVSTGLGADFSTVRDILYVDVGRLANGLFYAFDPGWSAYHDGHVYDGIVTNGRPTTEPLDDPVETLLLSTDGETWTAVDAPFFDGAISQSPSVAGIPGQLTIMTGRDGRFDPRDATWWVTFNGTEWTQVQGDAYGQWYQIGDAVVGEVRPDLMTVSGDGGLTFDTIEHPEFTDSAYRMLFTYRDSFRAIHWFRNGPPELWSSVDGRTWTELGPVEGLELFDTPPRSTIGTDEMVELPDGRILLTWREEDTTFTAWGHAVVSADGGRSWVDFDLPTLDHSTRGHQPWPQYAITVNGWVVLGSDDPRRNESLATRDGEEWIRIVGPTPRRLGTVNARGVVYAFVWEDQIGETVWIAIPPAN